MKAIIVTGKTLELKEISQPSLIHMWARIKVESVGLCGTDVAKLAGKNLPEGHTTILGHEFIGKVIEINGIGHMISVNDWVVCTPLVPCKECVACMQQKENLCVEGRAIGRTIPGAFAEFVDVPLANLIKIQDFHESYILADPLAVCLHAINLKQNSLPSQKNLVIGDGTIACLLTWLLLKKGQHVAIKGIHEKNLMLMGNLGAEIITSVHYRGYDAVYETVGRSQSQTIEEALYGVKEGGNVIVLGVYAPGYIYPLAVRELFIKETSMLGANAYSREEFSEAVTIISNYKSDLSAFLSHTFPLFKFSEALEAARHKRGFTMKIVLKPGGAL